MFRSLLVPALILLVSVPALAVDVRPEPRVEQPAVRPHACFSHKIVGQTAYLDASCSRGSDLEYYWELPGRSRFLAGRQVSFNLSSHESRYATLVVRDAYGRWSASHGKTIGSANLLTVWVSLSLASAGVLLSILLNGRWSL